MGQSLLGLSLGVGGFSILAIYTWVNGLAREWSAGAHWWIGLGVGGLGMLIMGAGWAILCLAGPHLEVSSFSPLGLLLCGAAFSLYVMSARWVGRWRAPSSYSLELQTEGIYRHVRHPQALALCILSPGLGLFTGSIPYLVTVPVWIALWTAYTYLEEKNELLPAFGDEYARYRERTPRLLPRLLGRGKKLDNLR
jgi:protein-S-isoprenylcysteine O-methyltransferase Ste14